jgi:hypothetical protein
LATSECGAVPNFAVARLVDQRSLVSAGIGNSIGAVEE